jgi:serine/threonine protein kinase
VVGWVSTYTLIASHDGFGFHFFSFFLAPTIASPTWSLSCHCHYRISRRAMYRLVSHSHAMTCHAMNGHNHLHTGGPWSPQLRDFLSQCLQKDPAQRWDAHRLLRHPWLTRARREYGHGWGGGEGSEQQGQAAGESGSE